jgi:hypothetical protein
MKNNGMDLTVETKTFEIELPGRPTKMCFSLGGRNGNVVTATTDTR